MPRSERLAMWVMALGVVALLVLVAVEVVWPLVPASSARWYGGTATEAASGSMSYSAVVVQVLEQGAFVGDDGMERPYQRLLLRLTSGDRAGEEVTVEDGTVVSRTERTQFRPGDRVYVDAVSSPSGERFVIGEHSRSGSMLIVALVFTAMVLLVGRGQGLRSLLGIGLSVAVIFLFIVPQIIAGRDPLTVSLMGAVFITVASTYLTFGWSVKAHAAVLSMLVSLAITAFLASSFLDLTHLSGLGSEESGSILADLGTGVDLRGILLGGILIGTLGVLDDMCVGQASTVFELAGANPEMDALELFRRGLSVGRDHISASVNTLVLAYAGASMPLFVLFALYEEPLLRRLSREPITEEVVRSLIGSMGLVLAVPITNLVATVIATLGARQREALMDDVTAALNRRGRWQIAELATELDRPVPAVEAALEDLAEHGFLHVLPRGECGQECASCELRVACAVGFGGKAWARTTGRAAVAPGAPAAGESASW